MAVHGHDPAGKSTGGKVMEDFGAHRSAAPARSDDGDRLRFKQQSQRATRDDAGGLNIEGSRCRGHAAELCTPHAIVRPLFCARSSTALS
jgi:hypothetical protein